MVCSKVKLKEVKPKGNRVLKGREKLYTIDPKPGDLSMARVKQV